MTRSIDTTEYLETVLSLLECGKTDVPVPIKGQSMVPFLREGDTVFLNFPESSPKKGDVVLFRRLDGSFVLHRIAKVLADGNYLLLGDNQTVPEPVDGRRILAIATSAKRKGKLTYSGSFTWWFYKNIWLWLWRLRPLFGIISKFK